MHNAGDGEAMLLYAVVTAAGDTPFAASAQDASGTFSVETFACPEGMTLATLETDACDPSAESLVQWSLASEAIDALLIDPMLRGRLSDISGLLQAEPGTVKAAGLIESLV